MTKQGQVPPDFNLQIRLIPAGPGDFGYSKELRRKGDSSEMILFELVQYSEVENFTIAVNHADVLRLYQEIVDQKIMKMKEEYANEHILDGGTTKIQIKMNGETKQLSLLNIKPPQLKGFFAIINEIEAKK